MLTTIRFNWAARKLYKRLLQLGANDIYPTGEADQQHPEGSEITLIYSHFRLRFCLTDYGILGSKVHLYHG